MRTVRWRPTASSLRAGFIAASVAWAVLLVAAPLLASRAHASAFAGAVIVGVYGIGAFVCHQLPERSIHLWSVQMPVCARCAGIYFGAVAGAIASAFRTAKAVRHDWPREVRHDWPREVRHDRAREVRHDEAREVRHEGVREVRHDRVREVRHDEAREVRHERTGPSPVAHGFSRAWARIVLSAAAAPTVLTLAYEWTTGGMPSHAIRAAAGAFIGAAVAWLVVAAADNQVN